MKVTLSTVVYISKVPNRYVANYTVYHLHFFVRSLNGTVITNKLNKPMNVLPS